MIHRVICAIPYLLVFLSLYLVDNIINFIKKEAKLCIPLISIMSLMAAVLIIYYIPEGNILKEFNLDYMRIEVREEMNQRIRVEIKDRDKMDKILEAINRQTYIRSAVRSVKQQNVADKQTIEIFLHQMKPRKLVYLYILMGNRKNNLLQIENQKYNIKDNEGVSMEIYNLLKEFGLLDK